MAHPLYEQLHETNGCWERENQSLGENITDFPIPSVSPKGVHIYATLNRLRLFYMHIYIHAHIHTYTYTYIY